MARDTFDTLIRLAGSEVDEARRGLQAVLAEEDKIRADMAALEAEVAAEEALVKAQPDLAGPYTLFAVRAKERREALEAALAELQPRIEAAREALAEAFANQKKYEIAKENRDRAEAEEEKRKEGIALDEMGLNAHRRKNA